MNFEIADVTDIPAMCRLLSMLFSQEAEFKPDLSAQTHALDQIIHQPEIGELLVARDQTGEVIGMVSLLYSVSTALGGRVALLEDMVMHPNYRNQGIGSQLLQSAIALAKKRKVMRITLLTDSDNYNAQSFYRRQGFHPSSMQPWRLILTQH